jgi:diguanylate cyclase (GGDEF)-like protein
VRIGLSLAAALAFFVLGELLLARIVQSEQQREADLRRYLAVQELSTLRARTEGLLNANLISMRSLRAEVALDPGIGSERFRRLAAELLSDDLHTRHIALAPDLVISHIYPEAGNEEALGLDYRENPEQYASIRKAIERDDIVINGPVRLVQGGEALIARVPVNVRATGEFWGVISVVIDHRHLFREAGLIDSDDWSIGLRGANGTGADGPLILGESSVWDRSPVAVDIELPVGGWVLAAVPASGRWERPLREFPLLWAGGSLLSLALAALIFSLLMSRTRLQRALSTISHQARFDSLTDLPNREFFMRQLGEYIHECRRKGRRFALLFIDLDHFKEINDTLGHEAGDELLRVVSERIGTVLRGNDLVARFGGDEFVVLLQDLEDPVDAEMVAGKLLRALHPSLSIKGSEVTIDGSIGIAVYPDDGLTTSDLLKHADLAMYAAKEAGRGTSYFFNDSLRHQAESQLHWHNEIKKGLAANQFLVHYQPIVDARTEQLVHVEALLRWRHPEHGMISPAKFIPIAERTGVIRQLGEFVLDRACADLQRMDHAGLDARVSINRSSREFNDRRTIMRWLEIIDRHGLARHRFTFEITESVLMPDKSRPHRLLRRLNAEGIRLSIDDFGMGYSSVTYLKRFPVSQLKIDRSFVSDINSSPEQRGLVEAIIKMAGALHLEVVAEGVERRDQAETLRRFDCDLLQGFLFARPMPVDQLIRDWRSSEAPGDGADD